MAVNYSGLSGLRNVLRAVGITKLVSYPARRKVKQRVLEYEKTKPSKVIVKAAGVEFEMITGDVAEYVRVQSFQDDMHLLNIIKDRLPADGTFWDIGSNIGLYSLYAAKVLKNKGNVVAFEPEKRAFARINENFVNNKLTNFKAQPFALADEAGEFELTVAESFGDGNHSLMSKSTQGSGTSSYKVPVYKGDDAREKNNIPAPSFVKVDVEGAEIKVLLGLDKTLRLPECKTVLVEVHFTILASIGETQGAKKMENYLRERGFVNQVWPDPSHLLATK
ncbi:MAG: FkbM family methyltransferase [Flavobacteriales bacterium]